MFTKHKKISTSLLLKEMQMEITILFTIRMAIRWKSGHPPMLVQTELPFIGLSIYIKIYMNLYFLLQFPCRTLSNRNSNESLKGINYSNVNNSEKIRNNLNTHQ